MHETNIFLFHFRSTPATILTNNRNHKGVTMGLGYGPDAVQMVDEAIGVRYEVLGPHLHMDADHWLAEYFLWTISDNVTRDLLHNMYPTLSELNRRNAVLSTGRTNTSKTVGCGTVLTVQLRRTSGRWPSCQTFTFTRILRIEAKIIYWGLVQSVLICKVLYKAFYIWSTCTVPLLMIWCL